MLRRVLFGIWWFLVLWLAVATVWGQARGVEAHLRAWAGVAGLGVLLAWLFPRPRLRRIAFPSPVEHPLRYGYIAAKKMEPRLCQQLIDAAESRPWQLSRHTQPTQDHPLHLLSEVNAPVEQLLRSELFPWVEQLYQLPAHTLAIHEAFVVKYDTQKRQKLELHRDASILTLSVALNPASAYEGGGTYFPCIDATLRLRSTGDLLVHCGKLQHGGTKILWGTRYLLVCFIDCSKVPALDHPRIASWNSAEPPDLDVMAQLYREGV